MFQLTETKQKMHIKDGSIETKDENIFLYLSHLRVAPSMGWNMQRVNFVGNIFFLIKVSCLADFICTYLVASFVSHN